MIFKYSQLKRFLKRIVELSETKTFREFQSQKCFLIRHDVDFDLEAALRMALIENEVGVKSTFFVLVNTENYNLFSDKNKKILKQIENLDHEIGLHFDASHYSNNFEMHAQKEASILENILSQKVHSIALHNPSTSKHHPKFKTYNDAYSDKYFYPEIYLSDSRFDFNGKDPFEFIEKIHVDPFLQILLHPIHFSENGEESYVKRFEEIFRDKINALDRVQLQNTKYRSERENNVKYSIHV